MSDWWQRFSATFAGGIAAIGLIAIPTFVWLPREFDELRAQLERIEELSKSSSEFASEAASEAKTSAEQGQLLTKEMAKTMAIPVGLYAQNGISAGHDYAFNKIYMGLGVFPAVAASIMSEDEFLAFFPTDVKESLVTKKLAPAFLYSNFAAKRWIFVNSEAFNTLTSTQQRVIQDALHRSEIEFEVVPR